MHQKNTFTRRDMLKLMSAGAAAAALPSLAFAADEKKKLPGVSLQLYSVRGDCAADFDKALAQVADMGFEGVEFAGYHSYGNNAAGLKKRLDDLGLKVAATHIGTGTLQGDQLAKTIDFHKELGCKYLIVPHEGRFNKPDGIKELIDIFNKAAEELKPHGMKCGYHNHTHEFDKLDGKAYWDIFAEGTVEDVVLQQDVGWTTVAGADAAEYIRKYPGRSQVIHLKPSMVSGDDGRAILGEDSVPWKPILTAAMEVGDTQWFTIEQESYPGGMSPMECTKLSLAGLNKILPTL